MGVAFIYGKLSSEKLVISKPLIFSGGVCVTSFLLGEWMATVSKEEIQKIRDNFSNLLKNELATSSLKKLKLSEVVDEFKDSEKKATEGKFTILIWNNLFVL